MSVSVCVSEGEEERAWARERVREEFERVRQTWACVGPFTSRAHGWINLKSLERKIKYDTVKRRGVTSCQ